MTWWAWLLVCIGLLALLCCLCYCCMFLCRYKKHKDEYKTYWKREVDKVVARPMVVEKPVFVDRPVFVEKPIIIEKRVRERPRRVKKQKRRKRKSKIPEIEHEKTIQIEHEEGPFIAVHNRVSDMTARSVLTFDVDPPSENYLQIEGAHPYHGRLLAPSIAETPMSLTPSEEHLQICADPSAYRDGYSVRDPSLYDGGGENQSYYTKDPRELGWNDTGSQTHYAEEPSGHDWVGNGSQSYYGAKEPSGHEWAEMQSHVSQHQEQPSYVSRASTRASQKEVQSHTSGHEWAEMQSHVSQHQEQPSYVSQAFTQASQKEVQSYTTHHQQPPPSTAKPPQPRKSSIFATFDDPLFTTEEKDSTFATFEGRRRRQSKSGGVSSDGDSDTFVYSHRTTTTM